MPTPEEIRQQHQRLAAHRFTLNHYLHQQAILGAGHVPPAVAHGIREARSAIEQIKQTLRAWGVTVDDHVDDAPPAADAAVVLAQPAAPTLVEAAHAASPSFFLSYSTHDEDFATALHARLRADGVVVWFAPADMQAGRKLHPQIAQAITEQDRLLLLLSEHSIQSNWVMTEIRMAYTAERRTQRRKLFPIRLLSMEQLRAWTCFDADSGLDLAVEVREYFIPDFSTWREGDAFEAAFARLLHDMRAASA